MSFIEPNDDHFVNDGFVDDAPEDLAPNVLGPYDLGVSRGADVLTAALSRRSAGQSLLSPSVVPSAAHVMQEIALAAEEFIITLTTADLAQPTRLEATVAEVIGHVIGRLERTATQLGYGTLAPNEVESYDHWASTSFFITAHTGWDGVALARALRDVSDRIIAAADAAESNSEARRTLGMAFELWMHLDDMRLALGNSLSTPSDGAVLAICTLAADLIAVGIAVAGLAMPGKTLRLVPTGHGGGTWLRALTAGEEASVRADAVLVADGVTFCRLFHRQISSDLVALSVEGDLVVIDSVLVGVQALAESA